MPWSRFLVKIVAFCIPLCNASHAIAQEGSKQAVQNTASHIRSKCTPSQTILAEPPKEPNADAFGYGRYYVNANRTLWVAQNDWQAGAEGNKVIWIRPAGRKLVVTGERIDVEAPPLKADPDQGTVAYGFTVIGLYFPAPGCWRIDARADNDELVFIARVSPARDDSSRTVKEHSH